MNRGKDAPVLEADDFLPVDVAAVRAKQSANLSEQIKAALGGRRQ